MKLLLHSNGPRSNTGYGVQIALLAARLADDGHEVAVSCNHGQQTGIGTWTTPSGKTIRLYPERGEQIAGTDIIQGHAMHWFDGNPAAGWIISLLDVFAFRAPVLSKLKVAAWAPVDHLLIPPGVLSFFRETGATPIAMSEHGRREFANAGIDAPLIPLAVDTAVFKPTPLVDIDGRTVTAREVFNLPPEAFVVGIVAMNKGNAFDRKGFSEAFYAFGEFRRRHPNAVLFVHSDRYGFQGIDLPLLAKYAGIPDEAIRFTDPYAYVIGFPPRMMAAAYTAMDVLLSPSHGEGFCVPLIEAQSCGVPVIASNATAQAELICPDAGWGVTGQPMIDPPQMSPAFCPSITDIVRCLEEAYAADLAGFQTVVRAWASQWDADKIYDECWRPFLAQLEPPPPPADKPALKRVAVIVPAMRVEHVAPLVESFDVAGETNADLYFVVDPDRDDLIEAVKGQNLTPIISDRGSTFAQKANCGYQNTDEDWLLLIGEDCRFTEGWLDKPRELSARYDVIGTNDAAPGSVRNVDVAAGRHADHWFTRRAYIDEQGACLEGPGVFCPEAYFHWWVDKEVIELAKARGVFAPCLDSYVLHLHPGYDGDEAARRADPVYMKAVEWAERDEKAFRRRVPLIEQHRKAGRG